MNNAAKNVDTVNIHTGSLKKNRIKYLDIARAFAILCVVLCHAVELIYGMNLQKWNTISIQAKICRVTSFTIGRLGVPIFLFLTGYLLLNRNFENDGDIKRFYKKNFLSLLLTTEIWIVIYNVFISIYYNRAFNIYTLIKNMLFFEKVPLMNTWYMPMILGIYLVIPYVSKIVQNYSLKSLKYPILLIFILAFILPTVNIVLKTFKFKQFISIVDISFLGRKLWYIYSFWIFN